MHKYTPEDLNQALLALENMHDLLEAGTADRMPFGFKAARVPELRQMIQDVAKWIPLEDYSFPEILNNLEEAKALAEEAKSNAEDSVWKAGMAIDDLDKAIEKLKELK